MSFAGGIDDMRKYMFIGKTIDPLLGVGDAYCEKSNGQISIMTEFEFEFIIRPADNYNHNWGTNER